ncbi:MAG: YCF48-related protein [Gammaproteobacteria bacterium]|nr:hypothetical protein [Xanthomonadales bacterium]MCB1604528.1 hypothetical protein [Xanthomonadales bacterium]
MKIRKFNKLILNLILLMIATVSVGEETVTSERMPKFEKSLYLGIKNNGTTVAAVGERGHVALSEDYGSTWIQAEGVPTRATLTAVSMIGSNIWAVGHDTTIIHSSDNGQTWTKQFEDVEREMPLLDVLFINESEGFAVGAYGTYLTTYDGGKNWNDGLISEDEDYHLNKIIKVDEFKYFVVAESGKAYRSFDSGNNWESLDLPYSGSMFGAILFGNEIITYGLRGNVLVTSDFGDTFEQIESPIHDSLFGSEHTINNKILLVGANGAALQYKNLSLSKVELPSSDGDYADVLSVKGNILIFIGENGISTKQFR